MRTLFNTYRADKPGLPILVCMALSIGVTTAAINPNLPLYIQSAFSVDQVTLGILLALNAVSGLIFTLALPYISDYKSNDRRLLVCVSIIASASFLILSHIQSVSFFIIAILVGFGPCSSSSSLFFSYARRVAPSDKFIITLRGLFSVAWSVAPALTTAAMGTFGAWSMLLVGGASCFVTALAGCYTRDKKERQGVRLKTEGSKNTRYIWTVLVSFIFIISANYLLTASTSLFLLNDLRVPIGHIGFVASASALLEIPIFFVLGRLNVSGARRGYTLSAIICGILYSVFISLSDNFVSVLLLQPLNAYFVATAVGVGLTWFQDMVPSRTGLMTGLFSNISRLSGLFAAPIMGILAAYFSTYRAPIVAGSVMLVVALAILTFAMREKSDDVDLIES